MRHALSASAVTDNVPCVDLKETVLDDMTGPETHAPIQTVADTVRSMGRIISLILILHCDLVALSAKVRFITDYNLIPFQKVYLAPTDKAICASSSL